MRTEKELDYLEKQIPKLAESAVQKAYLDALSRGNSVMEVSEGKIVKTYPDGTQDYVKTVDADIEVDKKYLVRK